MVEGAVWGGALADAGCGLATCEACGMQDQVAFAFFRACRSLKLGRLEGAGRRAHCGDRLKD